MRNLIMLIGTILMTLTHANSHAQTERVRFLSTPIYLCQGIWLGGTCMTALSWEISGREWYPSWHQFRERLREYFHVEHFFYDNPLSEADILYVLQQVNDEINQRYTYRRDENNWGVVEHWATPEEMESKGAGDCEDFAISKMFRLASKGFSVRDLLFILIDVIGSPENHAVLGVRTTYGVYLLDNAYDRVLQIWPAHYKPFHVLTFSDWYDGTASLETIASSP